MLKINYMTKFYRVCNISTKQGLWYDTQGEFTGLIHGDFNFCLNNQLKMVYSCLRSGRC